MPIDFSHVPIINVAQLIDGSGRSADIARQIDGACRQSGFFYVVEHGVSPTLIARLVEQSREFFRLPLTAKQEIAMRHGGRAWRGYFRVGEELTSGKPDQKEGLYFGQERPPSDALVAAGAPLHGPNLFPVHPRGLRDTFLEYMDAMTNLAHRIMAAIALGLGLDEDYFEEHGTRDPLTLFRIFNY